MLASGTGSNTISPSSASADQGIGSGLVWFRNVGDKAMALGQVTKSQAEITVWEREVKFLKHQFGIKLYDAMKMSRTMHNSNHRKKNLIVGKEEFQEVEAVYKHCESDLSKLYEERTAKQSELIKANNPKALCYNNAVASPSSEQQQQQQQTAGESPTEAENNTKGRPSPVRTASGGNFFQRGLQFGLQKAQSSVQSASYKSKLKSELQTLDAKIMERKQTFGIEMYSTLVRLQYEIQPRDPLVGGLYAAAKRDIDVKLSHIRQAEDELGNARESGGMLISDEEMQQFIKATPSLWAMLEANIGYPAKVCQETAFRVAVELMTGKQLRELTKIQVTKGQFKKFAKDYVDDPKGSQEFFHRSVFASFDVDGNGILDKEEIDVFLDTFYVQGSIFLGDARLPEKEKLKETILKELDENGDGVFSFDEIRSLITGSHALSTC